jgi:hypothetical protein
MQMNQTAILADMPWFCGLAKPFLDCHPGSVGGFAEQLRLDE